MRKIYILETAIPYLFNFNSDAVCIADGVKGVAVRKA